MNQYSLITKATNEAIDNVVRECFNGNSLVDNVVYNLDVQFNMVKANDIVHQSFAHWLPLYADMFNDIQRIQNSKPIRLIVLPHVNTYENFTDCFKDIRDFMITTLEPAIVDAILVAEENHDIKTKIMLENTYVEVATYTKQSIVWYEKALEYSTKNGGSASFDKDFLSFTIIPIE